LTASALGLGNFWRFSYLLGSHGGASFLLVYLGTLFLVAVPVMIAEVVVGSHGRANPSKTFQLAAQRSAISPLWSLAGWWMVVGSILLLAYYSVVAGWTLAYVEKMDAAVLADASAAMVAEHFIDFLSAPLEMIYWQTLFIALTFLISGLGIHRGLGVLFWFVVPLTLVVLTVLINFSLQHGDVEAAGKFLFSTVSFDFTASSVLAAMGHAFFTLGVGVGVGVAFGSYAPEKIPVGRTVLAVAFLDTFVAIFAGVAIFPLVFANNLEPNMGPALMFVSLPYAFSNMPDGEIFGVLFFLLVSVVTLASAVAVAEVAMSTVVERLRLRRSIAAFSMAALVWLLALPAALSFNLWQDVHWFNGLTAFQSLDVLTTAIFMPVAALLVTLFVGYALRREVLRVEMHRESNHFFFLWRACLRYIAPPVILAAVLAAAIESV
jgi:NSS family neurotransmitter:Na+ symporter